MTDILVKKPQRADPPPKCPPASGPRFPEGCQPVFKVSDLLSVRSSAPRLACGTVPQERARIGLLVPDIPKVFRVVPKIIAEKEY